MFLYVFQNAMLGNGLVLQNLLHMHMAQQQLLHIKDKHITNVRVCVRRGCLILHYSCSIYAPTRKLLSY